MRLSLESRKQIIKKLNKLLNNYDNLKLLCSRCNNDLNEVINAINSIIKYTFNCSFISFNEFNSILLIYSKSIDYEVKKNNKIYGIFNNVLRKKTAYENINFSSYRGLKIPSIDYLKEIIDDNIKELDFKNTLTFNYEKRHKELRGFDEVGFLYSRPELVRVNKKFNYYHKELNGYISEDFKKLYNDERYKNKNDTPLNYSFYENIMSISKFNDIQLTKLGDSYCIENGRHRLLYIIYNSGDINLLCTVSRRIEDRDFNIIARELRSMGAYIYKNNILNDNIDILICYNDNLYNIKSVDELKEFYKNMDDDKYKVCDFNISYNFSNSRLELLHYKKDILLKYKELGSSILDGNFTDVLKLFPNYNNHLFYDAFCQLQFKYQKYLINNDDLEELLQSTIKDIEDIEKLLVIKKTSN